MDRPTLRVATMNVWQRNGDWPARRDVLRKGFGELTPDVVACQETVLTADYDQVIDILGDGWHIAHQGRRESTGVGCSIASRWPLLEVHEVELLVTERVDPAEFAGRSTVAEIDGPAGRFLFANHKPSWRARLEYERELQAVSMARFIEEVRADRNLPVVLVGDFDAVPDATSVRFWSGRQALDRTSVSYRDAWEVRHPQAPGHTFSARNPLRSAADWPIDLGRRIDYVFVSCADHGPMLPIAACERLFASSVDGVWASDHFGVYADLLAPG